MKYLLTPTGAIPDSVIDALAGDPAMDRVFALLRRDPATVDESEYAALAPFLPDAMESARMKAKLLDAIAVDLAPSAQGESPSAESVNALPAARRGGDTSVGAGSTRAAIGNRGNEGTRQASAGCGESGRNPRTGRGDGRRTEGKDCGLDTVSGGTDATGCGGGTAHGAVEGDRRHGEPRTARTGNDPAGRATGEAGRRAAGSMNRSLARENDSVEAKG